VVFPANSVLADVESALVLVWYSGSWFMKRRS
jgi:hypothetical protein